MAEQSGRKFTLERDYYDTGHNLFKNKTVTIKPGVTVLVGCNGTGKTTLLKEIEHQLKKREVPLVSYDNLKDGGHNALSHAGYIGDIEYLATGMCSSEGENIYMNLGQTARKIGNAVQKNPNAKELWVLMDAVDSGLSVDNIVELKELLFEFVINDVSKRGADVYFVVSANEYELARGEQCLDVYNGRYIKFADYEEYRQFVLNSRRLKDNRYA